MTDEHEAQVIDLPTEPLHGLSSMVTTNPRDMSRKLQRYAQQRNAVLAWLGAALVENVDYGRIRICKRDHRNEFFRCSAGNACTNEYHWSKKSLWKPGAEKICGYLQLIPTWPNLRLYEERAASGAKVNDIILRCQLLNRQGKIVGEGVGGRDAKEGMNKAMKMAKKSSLVDAVLSTAGLSGIFTQDLEDLREPESMDMFEKADLCPIGPNTGRRLDSIDNDGLEWLLKESSDPDLRDRVQEILTAREEGTDTRPTAEPVEQETAGEIDMRSCYTKLDAAITKDELDRVWAATPERYQAGLRHLYEAKAKAFGEVGNES